MKRFFALGLCLVSSFGAPLSSAQTRPAAPRISVPTAGALGGPYASVGIARPLGGIAPPAKRPPLVTTTAASTVRYFGPVYYIPNAADLYPYYSSDYESAYSAPAQPYPAAAPASQPIVINQYFGTAGSSTQTTSTRTTNDGAVSTAVIEEAPPGPGDPLADPPTYYLIEYKNHTVYSALAYWLEGDTLHYVTTQNTHNQASLALIDIDATTRLNADRSVPFSIPGQ